MSIKVAQNDFTRKLKILTPLQKLPKNVGDLGKLIVAKGFKSCLKSNTSANLVTLLDKHLPNNKMPISLTLFGQTALRYKIPGTFSWQESEARRKNWTDVDR